MHLRRTRSAAAVALLLAVLVAGPQGAGPRPATAAAASVRELTFHFVDHSRSIRFPGRRSQSRPVTTEVFLPTAGARPFPLLVFGHGFDVTPATYTRLIEDWVRAGYVVAAPVFPLGNHDAPGGADESDLANQPRDMSFAITQLIGASSRAYRLLRGWIDSREVAVAGQSDGGSTALAAAYDRHVADRRIRAAVILSGALIPGLGGYALAGAGPPVLAVQGTADTTNVPASTYTFFDPVRQPKFLLRLLGAGHLPPYTTNVRQRTIVERVSIAFLDRYLKRLPGAARRMSAAGNVHGVATLVNR